MVFLRFYRYDFAVTQIFNDPDLATKYYGISISAQMLAYTPTSVIELLTATKKPFFVDPMTFVFARDIKNICRNGVIRRSYKKLMDEYGSPFNSCTPDGRLSSGCFKGNNGRFVDEQIQNVCKRVLEFEKNKFKAATPFAKYFQLLGKAETPFSPYPAFLVAPYFFAETYESDWYRISLRFAQQARSMKGNDPLYPVICISKDILYEKNTVIRIVKDYEGFDGYILWIDDLDEERVSPVLLRGLKTLVSKLADYGKPVLSLYGGYLCDLLGKFGLSGYSSGICYGEKRSVDTKGGGAGNRYYIPTVHVKISEDLANAFFAESLRNNSLICLCPTCSEIREDLPPLTDARIYSDAFFANMNFLDFRKHFVNVKFEESNYLAAISRPEVASLLNRDILAISNIDRIVGHPSELASDHLRAWRTLFE
jgi:hypothetical protein